MRLLILLQNNCPFVRIFAFILPLFLIMGQYSVSFDSVQDFLFFGSSNILYQYYNRIHSLCFSDYVENIFKCLTSTPRNELKEVRDYLNEITPEPRCRMMECEDKADAVNKYKSRKERVNVIVPPTCTGK